MGWRRESDDGWMRTQAPAWIGAFVVLAGRPPKNVWVVVDRRRNRGDPAVWEQTVASWPWLWLARLHARLRASHLALSSASRFVACEVMVTQGWVRKTEEPDSP